MKKFAILAVPSIALIGAISIYQFGYLNNSDMQLNTRINNNIEENFNILEARLTKADLPNVLKNIVDEETLAENEKGFTPLTLSEQHELAEWRAERGNSLEQDEVYSNYDKETIYALAEQGDVYALQKASDYLMRDLQTQKAMEVLRDAAALGSIKAFYILGARYRTALLSLKESQQTEEEIRAEYGIPTSELFNLEKSLEILSAAHYMTPALRGDMFGSTVYINALENYPLERKFTGDEWRVIIKNANAIYTAIDERREKMNADEFDNSYPAPYARLHGLPKENNMSEKFCEILEGDC